MSRIITHSNIIVDDFNFCKSFIPFTFIHFLTHFHSDHYQGLSPKWSYGEIHCTHQTKKFIKDKYPKINNIIQHEYNKPYSMKIKNKFNITVYMFDAKHIPGSAMILFQGYMGNILFTGDFRYQSSMIIDNPILFPPILRNNLNKIQQIQKMYAISIHIDQMIFDNTYCNQYFQFQTQSYIVQQIINIISKNQFKKIIYIVMGALGKHKILMKICQHFQTMIVVNEIQYKKIQLAGLRTDFLTLNPNEGYLHLINKKNRLQIIQKTKKSLNNNNFICIDTDFLMLNHKSPDNINYIVPYSLHSNYNQMKIMIRMIYPCILRKLIIPFTNFKQIKLRIKIDHRLKFTKYLDYIENNIQYKNNGYINLIKNYTDITKLSKQFLKWMKPKIQNKLMNQLELYDGKQNLLLRKNIPILGDQIIIHKSTKRSLNSIAKQLNAIDHNLTIQQSIQLSQDKQIQSQYSKIFSEHSFTMKSNSLSRKNNDNNQQFINSD